MRRRVVCPRSHPASLYARRPLADFAVARSVFPGGIPPGPPCRSMHALGQLGACHLRRLEGGGHLRSRVVASHRLFVLLRGVTAEAAVGHGWRGRGVPRAGSRVWRGGRPGSLAGRRSRESTGASLRNTEPGVTTRSGHFRSQSIACSVWPNQLDNKRRIYFFLAICE